MVFLLFKYTIIGIVCAVFKIQPQGCHYSAVVIIGSLY